MHAFKHLGRNDDRFLMCLTPCDDLFLHYRGAGDVDFQSKITSGHHDAIRSFDDFIQTIDRFAFFDFGNDRCGCLAVLKMTPKFFNVGGRANKTKAHVVEFHFRGPSGVFVVCRPQSFDAESRVRQGQALARTNDPTVDDSKLCFLTLCLDDLKGDRAITDDDPVAFPNFIQQ